MIYLDTSVALAHLLSEDRRPPDALWEEERVSSRLLEYELWKRIGSMGTWPGCSWPDWIGLRCFRTP